MHGARLTTLGFTIAITLMLSACGGDSRGTGSLGEAPPGSGGTGAPPESGSPTPAPESTVIQAKGFLQVEDLGNGGMAEILPGERVREARINPCGDRLPSDDQRLARAGAHVLFRFNTIPDSIPDGTAYEVISRYRSGGATAYLADLRAAVARCPRITEGDITYDFAIADSGFAGDESVLVTEAATFMFEDQEIRDTGLIAAVRLGELIIIIDADGWEMDSAHRPDVDRLVAAAQIRAAAA
jgi:hypothetical protein